jgi:hypothetical protein
MSSTLGDNRAVLQIDRLTPEELNDLVTRFPRLKELAEPRPAPMSTTEHRELGLLTIILTLGPPVLGLATAVINYLQSKKQHCDVQVIYTGQSGEQQVDIIISSDRAGE